MRSPPRRRVNTAPDADARATRSNSPPCGAQPCLDDRRAMSHDQHIKHRSVDDPRKSIRFSARRCIVAEATEPRRVSKPNRHAPRPT